MVTLVLSRWNATPWNKNPISNNSGRSEPALWFLIHRPPLEGLSQASTEHVFYSALFCRNLLVEMVCFRVGNEIAPRWQEWPSLLCILTFFNWWMVQHVSMFPWLFVGKLYIMCGFNSAWKIISLYVAVHYMYIICNVSISALNPWYCNGIPTLLNVFDMLVTVCGLNFFLSPFSGCVLPFTTSF